VKAEPVKTVFVDSKGRSWDLRIPFSERGFLRERGIDLAEPAEAVAAIGRLLLHEPEKLVEVAYKLGSRERNTVGPDEFAAGLVGGQCLYDLGTALSAAVVDFFPIPSARAEMMRLLRETLDRSNSTDSSLKPPGAPELATPAPEPSAS
jgi:hypothetical protein